MSHKKTLPKDEWKSATYFNPWKDGFYKVEVCSNRHILIKEVEYRDSKWITDLAVLNWKVPFDMQEANLSQPAKTSKAYWKS